MHQQINRKLRILLALHYVFEAEPGAKEYTIFASENPDFVNGMELTV